MTGFAENQVRALSGKLRPKHVKTRRDSDGKSLFYVEGWHVIAEANRIFGFDAWDRQTLSTECVWQRTAHPREHACSYIARVRVVVRAGDAVIYREASGAGHGVGITPGAAHESAIKEAETDAMKRALVTFGNPFGLALYDPELRGVRGCAHQIRGRHSLSWVVLSSDGKVFTTYADPQDFCVSLQRQLEQLEDSRTLKVLWGRHAAALEMLRLNFPELTTDGGAHWADALLDLYDQRLRTIRERAGADGGSAPDHPDSSSGERPEPRRVRDKAHLRFVASLPCLVCGRSPGHAHHIRFAQPRATGSKPGDQWVVPLCNTHHRALHDAGNEQAWWQARAIDPLAEAERLWQQHRMGQGRRANS